MERELDEAMAENVSTETLPEYQSNQTPVVLTDEDLESMANAARMVC